MRKLATGDMVNLAYVSGSSLNVFTCQFFDDFPQLEALMEEISTHVASLGTLVPANLVPANLVPAKPLSVGAPLLAMFSQDEVWYRAEVLAPEDSEGKVRVSFVDYGNTQSVSVASNTLPIPQRFTALHRQAATYCLGSTSGVTREKWSEEAFTKFDELAQASECLTATVLELREGKVVVIALKSDAGVDLAENIL